MHSSQFFTNAGRFLVAALLCCMAGPWAAHAEKLPVDISVSLDKDRVTIGDVVQYTATVVCPEGTELKLTNAPEAFEGFEIRDHKAQEKVENGKLHATFAYELQVFEVGEKDLAALELQYKLPDAGKPATVNVPAVQLAITSVLPPDAKDIKEIRDPVPVQMGSGQWLAAALLALAVLGLIALIAWLIVRKLRQRAARPKPRIVIGAHERAFSELAQLEANMPSFPQDAKVFYTGLTDIFREYLEARYGIHAMERTTWMIALDLEKARADGDWVRRASELLRAADLVKFARREAEIEDARQALANARELIERSKIVEPVPGKEAQPLQAAGN